MIFLQLLKRLPRFYIWLFAYLFGGCIYLGDKLAYYLLRVSQRTEYIRKGACQKTGQCCHCIALEFPNFLAKRAWFQRLAATWYRAIFNFQVLGTLKNNWLVFECHYLTKNNTCGIYPYRPKLCREFPLTPLFGKSNLHKGCGFWYLKRSEVGTFGEVLARREYEKSRETF